MGVEAHLGCDLALGVREALASYRRQLDSGSPPPEIPRFAADALAGQSVKALDLPVDEETRGVLEREAAKQGTTASELAAHSVLVYLAEIDRLTPASAA
ncbi:MAG TPA: hypothetical protein VN758_08635 [Solirubrobacterales bacterium]|nr:hypothetical protein [Solirubrobacterales bacterium]